MTFILKVSTMIFCPDKFIPIFNYIFYCVSMRLIYSPRIFSNVELSYLYGSIMTSLFKACWIAEAFLILLDTKSSLMGRAASDRPAGSFVMPSLVTGAHEHWDRLSSRGESTEANVDLEDAEWHWNIQGLTRVLSDDFFCVFGDCSPSDFVYEADPQLELFSVWLK